MAGYLYLFFIIRESKNYESSEKVLKNEPIHFNKKLFPIEVMERFIFLYDEYKNNDEF